MNGNNNNNNNTSNNNNNTSNSSSGGSRFKRAAQVTVGISQPVSGMGLASKTWRNSVNFHQKLAIFKKVLELRLLDN